MSGTVFPYQYNSFSLIYKASFVSDPHPPIISLILLQCSVVNAAVYIPYTVFLLFYISALCWIRGGSVSQHICMQRIQQDPEDGIWTPGTQQNGHQPLGEALRHQRCRHNHQRTRGKTVRVVEILATTHWGRLVGSGLLLLLG